MAKFEDEPNENIVVEQIINVLLKRYETFVCAIFSQKELLTLEELTRRLQLEENWSQNRS
jgi:hypothetical protein